MRIQNRFVQRLGGLLLATVTRWMGTLDYRMFYYSEAVDPVDPAFQGPAIFLFWHEYIPFPFYLRGHCDIAMLLSRHQDAEWLSFAARHMGFETVRGSTNRGGVAALRSLLRTSRRMNLTMTPDGPRGPRRRLAPGAIYLASRLEIPLILGGFGYDRPWRLRNTWDQFAIPRPYSRARMIAGPRVDIPAGLDREGIEHYRQLVEQLLNQVTQAAEQWATSGKRVAGQLPSRRQAAPGNREWRKAA